MHRRLRVDVVFALFQQSTVLLVASTALAKARWRTSFFQSLENEEIFSALANFTGPMKPTAIPFAGLTK